jgi:hypothetical protein
MRQRRQHAPCDLGGDEQADGRARDAGDYPRSPALARNASTARHGHTQARARARSAGTPDALPVVMYTILIIILVVALLGGGGFYFRR